MPVQRTVASILSARGARRGKDATQSTSQQPTASIAFFTGQQRDDFVGYFSIKGKDRPASDHATSGDRDPRPVTVPNPRILELHTLIGNCSDPTVVDVRPAHLSSNTKSRLAVGQEA